MSGLTTAKAAAYVDDSFGTTVRTAPVTPMKLTVETAAGNAGAAGTELASTTRVTIVMAAATGTPPVASNSATATIIAGAGGTVIAQAIYDSAGTPARWWWGPLANNRTVVTGDALAFAVGSVTAGMSSP